MTTEIDPALAPPVEHSAEQYEAIAGKASRGLRWSLLGNMVSKAASFVMSLILARLLAQSDFGVYAVALAATQFVMMIKDAGIITATVQWRGKLEEMAPTATVLNFVFASGLYALFYAFAPTFSAIAGSAEATPVVRILTAVILVEAVTGVRSAAMLRRFEHDKFSIALLAGFFAMMVIAITLAVNGGGAYSFAWGQLGSSVVTGILVLIWAKVPFKLGFDRAIAARLLKFGLPSAAGFGLEAVLMNSSYVIVGNALGSVALGYYLLAFNMSSWVPGLIGTAVRNVALPSFSRLAEEPGALSKGVQKAIPMMISFVLPVAVVMIILATPLVTFLYGEEWALSGGVLAYLAVLMVVRMVISFLVVDILASLGATKSTVWLNLGWAVALIPALYYGSRSGGIEGAAIAHAAVAVLVAVPLSILILGRQGVRFGASLPALVRPVAGAALASVVMVALVPLTDDSVFVELCVVGTAGMLVYALVVVPTSVMKGIYAKVAGKIRR